MSTEHEWRDAADRDFAALAVVTGTLEGDDELVALVLEPLDRARLIELVSVTAEWFAWAMTEANLNPTEHVQRVSMDLARRATGLDPDNG